MVRFKVSVPSALPGLVSGSRSRASAFLTGQPGADSRCEGRQTSQEGTVKLAASTLKGVHRAAIHFQNAGLYLTYRSACHCDKKCRGALLVH